jgi:hypothetical protein
MTRKLIHSLLGVALAAGLLLSAGAAPTMARPSCQTRSNRAEAKLNRDISRHGWASRAAKRDRATLQKMQALCPADVTEPESTFESDEL